jgi:hypothetical protein
MTPSNGTQQDQRPNEPTYVPASIWRTNEGETCVVKIKFARQVHIYGGKVNILVDQANWEYEVPPNHTCTILHGLRATFKASP